jgi:hypothetical protein
MPDFGETQPMLQQSEYDFNFESDYESGVGASPQSVGLRVRIVGYATPRWGSAKSAAEADRLNFRLSSRRADTVRAELEKELRARLGRNIRIDYAVSELNPRDPEGIQIGSYGAGSADALAAVHGDRTNNAKMSRKVDVMIEKITTTYATGDVSLPPGRLSGTIDSWAIRVTKLRVFVAAVVVGTIEIALRNRYTDKKMYATAAIYGGGLSSDVVSLAKGIGDIDNIKKIFVHATKNNLMQSLDDFIGRDEIFFTTKKKMGFSDFDGEFIRVGKAAASLVLKAVYAYARFPFIGHSPEELVFTQKFSRGWPSLESWLATGRLHLRGPNPGDWLEYDRTGQVQNSFQKRWGDSLTLTFDTGKWALSPSETSSLKNFVATWARRYP